MCAVAMDLCVLFDHYFLTIDDVNAPLKMRQMVEVFADESAIDRVDVDLLAGKRFDELQRGGYADPNRLRLAVVIDCCDGIAMLAVGIGLVIERHRAGV